MINLLEKVSDLLIVSTRDAFSERYADIEGVRFFWHTSMQLCFTKVNHDRLMGKSSKWLDEMISAHIAPEYLKGSLPEKHVGAMEKIIQAVDIIMQSDASVSNIYQSLTNYELDFSNNQLSLLNDKVNRDSTGAYYTPRLLAEEMVKKVFADLPLDFNRKHEIVDFSCGGGEFFQVIMDYLCMNEGVPKKESVKWFYGVDVDPIILQICITDLLRYADQQDWNTVVSHFCYGNPLIICDEETSEEEKNSLFASRRYYAYKYGIPSDFFNKRFDMTIGNPPWEKIRFEERKFFRGVCKSISLLPKKNERQDEIQKLTETWPELYEWYNCVSNDYSAMVASKYQHPLINVSISGELNTYALFTELGFNMLKESGIMALIVKSTLVSTPAHQKLWKYLLNGGSVSGVYLFENKKKIFNIDSRERFAIIVANKIEKNDSFELLAGLIKPEMLGTEIPVSVNCEELSAINPLTGTIPNINRTSEIEFLKNVHNQFPLFSDVYSECHFGRLIHLTAHSASIEKEHLAGTVPIYEGKFLEQYDGRYATFKGVPEAAKYANKASAKLITSISGHKELPECRFFVQEQLWDRFKQQYPKRFSLCWRSLTSPTNRRTMIAMILPTCPTCQSIQMLQTESEEELIMLLALFNSIPFDYLVRIKMPGIDLTQTVIKQIPVPERGAYEEIILFNGVSATLKKHILSYTVSILQEESRLDPLTNSLSDKVYPPEIMRQKDKQKMIDLLYKKAYHLDDKLYGEIIQTFSVTK